MSQEDAGVRAVVRCSSYETIYARRQPTCTVTTAVFSTSSVVEQETKMEMGRTADISSAQRTVIEMLYNRGRGLPKRKVATTLKISEKAVRNVILNFKFCFICLFDD